MLPYIQTSEGLHVHLNGRMRTISSGEPNYEDVVAAIKRGADEPEVLDILERELRRVQEAVEALNRDITDDVTIRGGQVLYRGVPIHNSLTERMLQQLNEGFDLVPMANFLANLKQNSSYRAVKDLYTFLEYGKMPITPDGCFLAYKAVRGDFKDIHSGTFDNSPGQTVEMPRNEVNEDPTVTCSYGLHVCSFEYLPSFAHADGHVVICKVNPRDVVAIPTDYNNTKMRVCRYEVLREYEGYYKERGDRLGGVSVATDGSPFRLEITGHCSDTEEFDRLPDAMRRAADLLEFDSTESVKVVNTETGAVLFEQENEGYEPEDDEDDEDEDEGRDSFEVHYFLTEADLNGNVSVVYASDIDDIDEAMESAFEAYREKAPFAVHVVDADTGEVKKKVS